MKRRRAWTWCWAIGFAMISAYIAFDVLDIDGSELQKQLRPGAVATATAQSEAERLFRLELASSDLWTCPFPGAERYLAVDALRIKAEDSPRLVMIRRSPILPRRLLSRAAPELAPPLADPDPA
jgi:hypothetical protein